MKKGYVQVYTGNGKGKTTAALGVALRAAGAGHHVFIGQFTKGRCCCEHTALERFADLITIKRYGEPGFILDEPSAHDKERARQALEEIRHIVSAGNHELVILDEANIATHYKLIDVAELLDLIQNKPDPVELILTGRYADPRIMEAADLVTEMAEIKHYSRRGVPARTGIEE